MPLKIACVLIGFGRASVVIDWWL